MTTGYRGGLSYCEGVTYATDAIKQGTTFAMRYLRGFTLIELLITVAVAGVLLTITVPSFQGIIIKSRISTQANELVSDLAFARSEAIKQGAQITVCTAVVSTAGCSAAGTNWNSGRLIFVDSNRDGDYNFGETILRFTEALKGGLTLTSVTIFDKVAYYPSGIVTTAGTFTLCKTGYIGRVATIGATGRVSTANTAAACP